MVPDRSPGSGGAAIVNTGPVRLTDWKFNSNTLDLNAGTRQFITYQSVSKTIFLLYEVLIPVKHLVNGTTIAQIQVDTVIYCHVELPAHDVVLAAGLPAERYLETGDRANFANVGAVVRQFSGLLRPGMGGTRVRVARRYGKRTGRSTVVDQRYRASSVGRCLRDQARSTGRTLVEGVGFEPT
ncbi:MAG TPA: Hint domain-containing protein [Acetobacteraceae bacterium]|nr:Hint domain-containing protein [Acetobacteraceae bacterium]